MYLCLAARLKRLLSCLKEMDDFMVTTIDNIKINYEVRGEGQPVLLLHGWGANIKLFDGLMNLLATKYRVYALDMPGFGGSEEPPCPWCVDDYTDFVLYFIEEQGIKEATLLGHSFGGRVIIKMLSRQNLPFTPLRVILVDAAGIKPKRKFKNVVKVRVFKMSKWVLSLPPVKKLYPDALETLRKKNGSADYNAASPLMRQCLVRVVNEDLTHLLPNIKVPTLLVWGENDMDTPLKDAQLMEKLIPDAGLVTLKNAGHFSFLEQQYTFHKVIASFMKLG